MQVQVQGHTDSIGTKSYNDALSMRRAQAVKTYLVNKGVQKERLSLEGFGFSKPVAPNNTAEGRALNRRVELHRK
jgi:OOP family OmpA-OmpF porin